jgi:hypothetical protein
MHKDDEDRGRPNDRNSLDPIRLSLPFYASKQRPWSEAHHTCKDLESSVWALPSVLERLILHLKPNYRGAGA